MIINFQKNTDKLKAMVTKDQVDSIYNVQLSYGKILETNLINALHYMSKEHIMVQRCTEDMDRLFGADFKIQFINPHCTKVNNMSVYVDITLDMSNLHHNIPYKNGKSLAKLDNGLLLYIGIKTNHYNLFYYKKPLITLCLTSDYDSRNSPMFSEYDVQKIVKVLRDACMFITQRKISNVHSGMSCRYASNIIELNHKKFIFDNYMKGDNNG